MCDSETICQLVGHSMGGSPATRITHTLLDRGYRLRGLVVLDTVEMTSEQIRVLKEAFKLWPTGFVDIQAAIDWQCVLSSTPYQCQN